MKKLLFLATAVTVMVGCANDDFVGDNSPTTAEEGISAISFDSGFKTITRADHVGADAASMLNNHFTVGGFKGTYTSGQDVRNVTTATGTVFDNYLVNWAANTAATTASNTADWEYVGLTAAAPSGIASNTQSIKYWDYTASQYDFIAYSTGAAEAVTATPSSNQVQVTAITPTTATSSAYTLSGSATDLAKCYIADMVTVYKNSGNFGKEVQLTFRSLASKVRVALYETVPGYSVKDVKFYSDASTTLATGTSNTNATLFTTGTTDKDNFYTGGTYTVKFPTIGSTNTSATDYNKAHVSFTKSSVGTTKEFGTLNLVGHEYKEADATNYIGRSLTTASFAGTSSPYYQIAMPNEEGTVLELRVDYTLLSIDGSGEEIKVHGATAFVPVIYAAWKPNYAYTYIFKISDNTNGWTSTAATTDPAGLYPITFDAVAVDSEEHTQSTVTTVATPSITTYQLGHVYTDGEYDASKGDIYIQVMDNNTTPATLKNDLNSKSHLYTVTGAATATEADVVDALNLRVSESGDPTTIVGRNGLSLTTSTVTVGFTTIPGADGNNITVTANTAAKFTPTASTTYAYVYDTSTYGGDYYYSQPTDWPTGYYTDAACETAASTFSAGTYYRKSSTIRSYENVTSEPTGWPTDYYTDEACTTAASSTFSAGYYYHKYTVNNKIYGVKVIKVKP